MRAFAVAFCILASGLLALAADTQARRYLYVAVPGIRKELEHGGHGLLVFDVDAGHKFVRRIKTSGLDSEGQPLNVKGICASAATARLYITTTRTITCLDLHTDKILWEKTPAGGCDRMSISPDGKVIYVPSFEGPHWNVLEGASGERIAKITPNSGAHNTVYGSDGRHVYLAGLRSPWLTVADTATHSSNSAVGPFSASIRPFTINFDQTLAFCCVNDLLGFEVGDIRTGTLKHRVVVEGFKNGTPKRHGCPSHGIGLTPDESEVWVCDAVNRKMHVFDATVMPPRQKISIDLRDEPGWITFTVDGEFAYPSTGDVIETRTKRRVAQLTDETGAAVQSEKLLEVVWRGTELMRVGDQFGVGRRLPPPARASQ